MGTLRHALTLALLFGVLSGCVTQPVQPVPAREAQIIVKFKPKVTAAADPAFVTRLSRDIAAPLTYVRAMAGMAHIFRLGYDRKADLDTALAKLNRHPDVEYAELDRIMRISQ